MHSFEFIVLLAGGFVLMGLPVLLPLFFCWKVQRKALFYVVGVAICYLCYKVAIFMWAFFCVFLGYIIAYVRHQDVPHAIHYGFAMLAPGHLFMGLLPMMVLSTLLSVIALRKIRESLFKPAL